MAEDIIEIKKLAKTGKLIYGIEQAIKKMREGSIEKVYIASNTTEDLKKELKHYAGISNVTIIELPISNIELGTTCKKQFSVSVLGLLKG